MNKPLQAIRGMNDILPMQTPLWRFCEARISELLDSYGYQQIRLPIVEYTELFKRSIGDVTDIVEKEMYSFTDRNGDALTLRPEGTASCVRAVLEHHLCAGGQPQKLWYNGPMFRHERPQKGRYRQFHQIGIEAFQYSGPEIDAELIALTWRLWNTLQLQGSVHLEINSLGSAAARADYREALTEYLQKRYDLLDTDSQRRLTTNPLRILDSKAPETQNLLSNAPQLTDFLDAESRTHFAQLCAHLDALHIPYTVNPKLVRGLDYYSKTVFEWITDQLGAQSTVCAGGRYDGLVEQLGGTATPGIGLAIGLERLILLLETCATLSVPNSQQTDVYLVAQGAGTDLAALGLAEEVRSALPGIRLMVHAGSGSLKSQLKKADKSGALFALVLGEHELATKMVGIKSLRTEAPQQQSSWANLPDFLIQCLPSYQRS